MERKKGFTISELVLVLLFAGIIAMLMLPIIRYSKRNMARTICINNLQQIGLAMYIYAREHDGNFPPSAQELYKTKYLSDPKLLDCLATKEKGTLNNPDYIYTAGLSVKSPSDVELLRDKGRNHSNGMNILYVNGLVKYKEF